MAALPQWPVGPVDQIVSVMERAFDPAFGEAWNRRQVEDALLLGTCGFALIDEAGDIGETAEGAAAGFYLWRSIIDEAELLLIAVDPRWRGRGYGGALLSHFIASAADGGARRAFLEMRSSNPAGKLYRAHGFAQVGVRPAYYRGADGRRHDAESWQLVFAGA